MGRQCIYNSYIVFQCQLSDVRQQLTQQSEFCSSMGACACSLLWRVSRIEDNVDAILSGVQYP
jgi:hypothetical protein